jgi:hypothetical protein
LEISPSPPSSYAKGRIYGCVVDDDLGLRTRGGDLGIDQITFESDYPHLDSTWPETKAYAEHAMADFSREEVYKVARSNAITLFSLPDVLPEQPSRGSVR